MPATPLLLVDNVFDSVQLYPAATVTASSERTGHEAYRLADYRRERTSWQTATSIAGHAVQVDLGATGARDVDSLYLDRGHNLFAHSFAVQHSPDGSAWTTLRAFTAPAAGTLAGDPTSTTGAVTEEGAWWALFTASGAARRYWRLLVTDTMAPVVTGAILGLRSQLLGYSTVFDEDAGERTEDSQTSKAGYRATDTTYSWRILELGFAYIGATEYDGMIRTLRERLFKRNQPFVAFMDYASNPERGWLYQYDGKAWGFAKKRVYRDGRIRCREVGHSLS